MMTDTALGPLSLLADSQAYRPCAWDLSQDAIKRSYWLGLFASHFPKLLAETAREAADAGRDPQVTARQTAAAAVAFDTYLETIAGNPQTPGANEPLTILEICYERERVLRQVGIADPYRLAKQVENQQALAALPALLQELDAMPEADRWLAVMQGVFAGNIFDLGATKTVDMFADQRVDFHATRARLKPRPWFIDGLDAWQQRLRGPAHRAAVVFVDNAGPDVLLGMIPFSRELLRRGTRVILASNTDPSLNDITHVELLPLLETIARFDPLVEAAWAEGRLQAIASGNGAPLIDLRRLAMPLLEAIEREGVDLVVLEGMGRGVESNLEAALRCDTLKLAMIKDQGVADGLAGQYGPCGLFDLVLRFDPAR